jgi:hypothetical protein
LPNDVCAELNLPNDVCAELNLPNDVCAELNLPNDVCAELNLSNGVCAKAKKNNMCAYGHPTHPNFQPLTLTFFICNYSILIFASDPINFYTEFG